MTYNDIEYAIVTALGYDLRGQPALDWIHEEFGIAKEDLPSIATYWRYLGKLTSTFPGELEKMSKNVVQKHMARLHMFYNTRTKLHKAMEAEKEPIKIARIIAIIDKHEVLISQLESLSRKYLEKQAKEALAHQYETMQIVVN